MALQSLLRSVQSLRVLIQDPTSDYQANRSGLVDRLADVFLRTWDLGFTAFGGPPVHFQILHARFVQGSGGKAKWVDEQTYQELFALTQGLPGPGSTKMACCLAFIHAGMIPAMFVFLLWSLPGAIGMFGLSLGVREIGEKLPDPVYALLSGLNASTVGIIALAAVQLATNSIKDQASRIVLIGAACAGLCYNALWYFPVLMVIGGVTTMTWDLWLRQLVGKAQTRLRRRKAAREEAETASEEIPENSVPLDERRGGKEERDDQPEGLQKRTAASGSRGKSREGSVAPLNGTHGNGSSSASVVPLDPGNPTTDSHALSLRTGIIITVISFAVFIGLVIVRGVLPRAPLPLSLFLNMYLAGMIIFGGGPVVIPLLREYVVHPGWVSSRDFLLGLAIIQAFPGPNFNFAVYLGALAMLAPTYLGAANATTYPMILGAALGYVGMFLPGLALAAAAQSFWRVLRTKPVVTSVLRGLNSAAVGLVFTAVYRLWEIGYLTKENSTGQSLAREPWWVVVAALSYAQNAWFKVPAAGAIVMGGILGLAWWGAVGRFQ